MSRKPNFDYDNDVIGSCGEKLFEDYANKKSYNIVDVRTDQRFQIFDIDYIVILNNEYDIERILEENLFTKYDKHKNNWVSIEVKTDTRTHSTRNVVYEILSHDNPGCMARSLADMIFYVAVNEDASEIYEKWAINTKKWREWIRITSPKLNGTVNEPLPIRLNNFNTYKDKCLNFLCNIDRLVSDDVAVKITII